MQTPIVRREGRTTESRFGASKSKKGLASLTLASPSVFKRADEPGLRLFETVVVYADDQKTGFDSITGSASYQLYAPATGSFGMRTQNM
jgi:hypothetical protein